MHVISDYSQVLLLDDSDACVNVSAVRVMYARDIKFTGSLRGWRDRSFCLCLRLCLCRSYSVLTVCITSFALQTRLTRSSPLPSPDTDTHDSLSIVSPGSSTRREHLSADTGFSKTPPTRLTREQPNVEVSPLGSLA